MKPIHPNVLFKAFSKCLPLFSIYPNQKKHIRISLHKFTFNNSMEWDLRSADNLLKYLKLKNYNVFLFCQSFQSIFSNIFLFICPHVLKLIHNIHSVIHMFDLLGQLGLSNISTIFTRHISTTFVKRTSFLNRTFGLIYLCKHSL